MYFVFNLYGYLQCMLKAYGRRVRNDIHIKWELPPSHWLGNRQGPSSYNAWLVEC